MTAAPHVDPRLLPGTPSLGGWRQDACFCAFLLRCRRRLLLRLLPQPLPTTLAEVLER
jgi:hypothetical protein